MQFSKWPERVTPKAFCPHAHVTSRNYSSGRVVAGRSNKFLPQHLRQPGGRIGKRGSATFKTAVYVLYTPAKLNRHRR